MTTTAKTNHYVRKLTLLLAAMLAALVVARAGWRWR